PLKAVRFDYVEPIRYFGSMSVDLVVSSPVDGARTSPLKVLLDTGAKRNYLSKALADNLRSRLHVDPVDLPSPHVSSQVDGTILRATKSLKLRTAATTPCGSDPVIQFLILDEVSPSAIIGLDGMKRLRTEIVLDDKVMIQFKPLRCPEPDNIVTSYHGDLVAVLDEHSTA
ncbi:hypothetical protein FOZ63_021857, partial [Perkinsus olseni]